jgi:hypothetical protein
MAEGAFKLAAQPHNLKTPAKQTAARATPNLLRHAENSDSKRLQKGLRWLYLAMVLGLT